jgi:hypothetical protein
MELFRSMKWLVVEIFRPLPIFFTKLITVFVIQFDTNLMDVTLSMFWSTAVSAVTYKGTVERCRGKLNQLLCHLPLHMWKSASNLRDFSSLP